MPELHSLPASGAFSPVDSPRLNLAALTAEELVLLLGEAAAQRLMPEVSQARLEGRVLLGHAVPAEQLYEAQAERGWGATPEAARRLSTLRSELVALGGVDLGVYYLPLLPEVRHQRAYVFAPDTALSLRWSESPESAQSAVPFLVAATLLKDRASGTAAVLSSTAALPFVPTQSEEIDARLHQGASPKALLEAHHTQVARHGRGVRLANEADWLKVQTTVRRLNLAAWTRRGLLG
ncbi:hypothetical protein MF271_16000 [Deinococcus sp. KNUC1210]|uniref:hypothetical protein n=1 Tax=Deinococcus sp. KNUC1210 TaxID=2917691 RepID=UPI001EEFCA46|nr:hypothetical protein [Deinococcus sp. KNUC1210]ULH15405.1 hypothetical protein MF271_16000 [Deinococcus sp. KNUC1210]